MSFGVSYVNPPSRKTRIKMALRQFCADALLYLKILFGLHKDQSVWYIRISTFFVIACYSIVIITIAIHSGWSAFFGSLMNIIAGSINLFSIFNQVSKAKQRLAEMEKRDYPDLTRLVLKSIPVEASDDKMFFMLYQISEAISSNPHLAKHIVNLSPSEKEEWLKYIDRLYKISIGTDSEYQSTDGYDIYSRAFGNYK